MKAKSRAPSDAQVASIRKALIEGLAQFGIGADAIAVKRHERGWIRIRVIHGVFEDATDADRDRMIMPILRVLPDETYDEISMIMLIGPHAARRSVVSEEFDNPKPYPAVI